MDSVQQSEDWLLNIHRKLYQWSKAHTGESYRDLWNLITDMRNLQLAWQRVSTNKGRSTPGIDGVTVKSIKNLKNGSEAYLRQIRKQLREGSYCPSPVKRKWIPKPGKPHEKRGLGIPTIKDRIVQSAILQIIEPLFEARFLHVSHGFRPGRAVRDAIEVIRRTAGYMKKDENGRKIDPPYNWVIEGDIKKCFDEISHHSIMKRTRRTIADRKVLRLLNTFLKGGIMEECKYIRTEVGTPQGGILSPLLANVALSVIEERYKRWVYPIQSDRRGPFKDPVVGGFCNRRKDRSKGKPIFYPVRYADDFILIASGTVEEIEQEKQALGKMLHEELGVELSEEKTKVTKITDGFYFLGHHIRHRWNARWGWVLQALIPLDRQARLRHKIKSNTKRNSHELSLGEILKRINPIIRGWGNFYKHTNGAYGVFRKMDYYIFMRIFYWLRAKHKTNKWNILYRKYRKLGVFGGMKRWTYGQIQSVQLLDIPRSRWDLKKRRLPAYMMTVGEPGA